MYKVYLYFFCCEDSKLKFDSDQWGYFFGLALSIQYITEFQFGFFVVDDFCEYWNFNSQIANDFDILIVFFKAKFKKKAKPDLLKRDAILWIFWTLKKQDQ